MSGKRRPPRRPYYPNQRFQQYNQGGYNFSSDVSMDNQGGAFVYGGGPPPQYHQPQRSRGYGYPPRGRGWGGGGGYQQYGYGGPPRGFRPPGNFRGRFQRPGYVRGGPFRPYGGPRQRMPVPEGDDPYYHPSMFEDPWRFLLPKEEKAAESGPGSNEGTKDANEVTEPSSGGVEDGGVAQDGGVASETDAEVRTDDAAVVAEECKKEVDSPSEETAAETGDGGGEAVKSEERNGEGEQGGGEGEQEGGKEEEGEGKGEEVEGGEGGDEEKVVVEKEGKLDEPREDEEIASTGAG